jgi:ABC-2 type transport system permease protein
MGLAGTDFEQHRHFSKAAEAYRRDIQRTLNDDIARNQRAGQPYLANADLWSRVPDFTYEAPSVGWVLERQATALTVLAGWLLLAGGLAVLGARRLSAVLG